MGEFAKTAAAAWLRQDFYFLRITLYYMGVVTLRIGKKLEETVLSDLREFNYSTKTEYFRQAIRELHQRLRTEKAIAQLARNKGFAKRMGIKEPTEEGYELAREEAFKEIVQELKSKSLQAKSN